MILRLRQSVSRSFFHYHECSPNDHRGENRLSAVEERVVNERPFRDDHDAVWWRAVLMLVAARCARSASPHHG